MTNILLITADDMDGRTPGSFGGPAGLTPALDKLAAEGMVFGRGHVPIAVCQPSRSALMTGMWPHRNGAEGLPAADPTTVLMYNQPGRSLTIHPVRGTAGAGFIFRGPARPTSDYRDIQAQQRIVLEAYPAHAWAVPELPDLAAQVRAAEDLYFDSVSRVRLPSWSRGRITLLGDAASCVSLFGDGSSLAIIAAATLAQALAASPDDPTTALHGYESRHRRLANSRHRGYPLAAALLVPATRTGLALRNLTARLVPR